MRSGPSTISAAARCSGSRRALTPPGLRLLVFLPPLPVREGGRGRERRAGEVRAETAERRRGATPRRRRPGIRREQRRHHRPPADLVRRRTGGSPHTRRRTPRPGAPCRPAAGRAPRAAARRRRARRPPAAGAPGCRSPAPAGRRAARRRPPRRLDLGPTSRSSERISGSCTRQRNGVVRAGAASSARSASSSTRCITPTVSGLPQAGQRPSRRRVSGGSSRTPQARWPSRWYFPSSGKNSTVPPYPSPVSSARRIAK